MTTIRAQIEASLKPLLPKAWTIVPTQRTLDVFTKPVVMLKQDRIEHAPTAPLAAHLVSFIVTVADPNSDPAAAEDDLDAEVSELLLALGAIDYLNWTEAQKVLFQDRYLAYDITLQAITRKD